MVMLICLANATAARHADVAGAAPRQSDAVLPMFNGSAPTDTTGAAPVWSLAVRDSGRRVELITNRFVEPGFGSFPADSVMLRRFETHVVESESSADHVAWGMSAGVANLHVSANGQPSSEPIRWVVPDTRIVTTDAERIGAHPPIPLNAYWYCLSRDGKSLLVLHAIGALHNTRGEPGHFGLLDYFDVSNPKRPRRIGPTLEADGSIMNGAVSNDGSRVAVAILFPDTLPRNRTKIVVLDRAGRTLSAPHLVAAGTTSDLSLQFEGRFLFVGTQRTPGPIPVTMSTTATVSLYELRH
jgi:hypothetical protein